MTCFNYREPAHVSIMCQKPKKAQSGGEAFALNGGETTRSDNLIQGTCFINGVSMSYMIYTCVTHSFISLDDAPKLNLEVPFMVGSMVIDTQLMVW